MILQNLFQYFLDWSHIFAEIKEPKIMQNGTKKRSSVHNKYKRHSENSGRNR